MSIVYEGFGNVLTHGAKTLVCPVNVVGVMGAGLARAFRNRVPGLNQFYKQACEVGDIAIGKVLVYPIPNTDQQVLLFPTKGHWKDPSEVSYVQEALEDLAKRHGELDIQALAMPPVGCGLGKLDYQKDVFPLIEEHLGDVPGVDVYILLRP